jgi:hypothetical protein
MHGPVRRLDLRMADLRLFAYARLQTDATVTGRPETTGWSCPATGTYSLILDSYGTDTGGQWTLGYEVTCPTPVRVCCVGHNCELVHEDECAAQQGRWHPEWESCGPPSPCDVCTPADRSTRGSVKARYR